jgi:glycolate oxidase iron-sulfur subunit
MQTRFSTDQLKDPKTAEANRILRKCVHCGFCTATCPTYVLLGDELDSPRGRIYLIKDMLENARPATGEVVKHIDRCLSCLACMTTCPSGVHYMHLIDQARVYVENTYRRPLFDRLLRRLLAFVMPETERFRTAMKFAQRVLPLRPLFAALPALSRLHAALALVPSQLPAADPLTSPGTHRAQGARRARVALLTGCVQPVLNSSINAATVRLLTRLGVEVVIPEGSGCCGALTHHLGMEHDALARARRMIDLWIRETYREELDAIIINASGCGTVVKDYGYLFAHEPSYRVKAAKVASLTKDVTEFLSGFELARYTGAPLRLAYHSACSMQHGQQLHELPKQLLGSAGFEVVEVPEAHLCCGSAGTYNILQPEIAERLRERKLRNIERTRPDIVVTGNIGCITQLSPHTSIPVVHTVELLDWAAGGPQPFASEAIMRPEWRGSR